MLALLRVSQTTHVSSPESIETYAGEEQITLHGFIIDEPDRRPLQTKYTVAVEGDKVLVTDFAAWPDHAYGDEVRVVGILEKPGMIEDFPYDRYLSRYGIYATMPHASVETISSGHGFRFFTFLFGLKERFERRIAELHPEPHASFLAGLLTGSRRGIPTSLLEDFQATGLTHIIAISGYNITIVLSVIGSLLFFFPLRWRLLPSLLAIAFFTLFVGASPSVVRAALMGGLGLLALHAGRQKHALIAMLAAAAAMTAWNPKLLWYDAGFQLSFLSVLGLTYVSPLLAPVTRFLPEAFGMREAFTMTIAAQLAAVPLVIFLFGNFSLVAPLTNVLIALPVPAAMLFGFLGTALSFISFPTGQLVSYIAWGALELIIRIAHLFAGLPAALFHIGVISPLWIFAYYALLVFLLTMRRRRLWALFSPMPRRIARKAEEPVRSAAAFSPEAGTRGRESSFPA